MRISFQATSSNAMKTGQSSSPQPPVPGFKDAIASATHAASETSAQTESKKDSRSAPAHDRDNKSDHEATASPLSQDAAVLPVVVALPQQLVDAGAVQGSASTSTTGTISGAGDGKDSFALALGGSGSSGAVSPKVSEPVSTSDATQDESRQPVLSIDATGHDQSADGAGSRPSLPGIKIPLMQAGKELPDLDGADKPGSSKLSNSHEATPTPAAKTPEALSAAEVMQPMAVPMQANALQQVESGGTKSAIGAVDKAGAGTNKDATLKQKSALSPESSGVSGAVSGTGDKHKVEAPAAQGQGQEQSFDSALSNGMKPAGSSAAILPVDASANALAMAGQPAGMDGLAAQPAQGNGAATVNVPQGSGGVEQNAGAPSPAAGQPYAAAATPQLSSAQLVQSMHGSEMRIGMHSAEFGAISVNTSVTRQTLAAQISFDHPELGKALAAHIPAMEEKLGSAYGLQARVEVRDNGSAATGGNGRESAGNERGQGRASPGEVTSHLSAGAVKPMATPSTLSSLSSSSARLDIRI